MTAYYLKHNQQKQAIKLADLAIGAIDQAIAIPALKNYIKSDCYKTDSHFMTELIYKMQSKCKEKCEVLAGALLLSVCDKQDKRNGFILTKRLLLDFERHNVNISSFSAKIILNNISACEMGPVSMNSFVVKLINDQMFEISQQRLKLA